MAKKKRAIPVAVEIFGTISKPAPITDPNYYAKYDAIFGDICEGEVL